SEGNAAPWLPATAVTRPDSPGEHVIWVVMSIHEALLAAAPALRLGAADGRIRALGGPGGSSAAKRGADRGRSAPVPARCALAGGSLPPAACFGGARRSRGAPPARCAGRRVPGQPRGEPGEPDAGTGFPRHVRSNLSRRSFRISRGGAASQASPA